MQNFGPIRFHCGRGPHQQYNNKTHILMERILFCSLCFTVLKTHYTSPAHLIWMIQTFLHFILNDNIFTINGTYLFMHLYSLILSNIVFNRYGWINGGVVLSHRCYRKATVSMWQMPSLHEIYSGVWGLVSNLEHMKIYIVLHNLSLLLIFQIKPVNLLFWVVALWLHNLCLCTVHIYILFISGKTYTLYLYFIIFIFRKY